MLANGIVILLFVATSTVAQILPEDPSSGGALFVSKGCMKCHSVQGAGGKIGPDLGFIGSNSTKLELAAEIWNHTPFMIEDMKQEGIAKPTLSGQEFAEITAYLYFFRFVDKAGDAAAGEYYFSQKGCKSCHRDSGRSDSGAPGLDEFPRNVSPVFMSQTVWKHSLRMMARMVRKGQTWPGFNGTEMMDTLAYIQTKATGTAEPVFKPNPREGRTVFTVKGCIKCHSVYGEGAKGGTDLGKRAESFYTSLSQIASSMWNKSPEMILFKIAPTQGEVPQFTTEEMTDLLAYLYFLHYTDAPGDASRGDKIFSAIGCAQCHGFEGKRGTLMSVDLTKYRNSQPIEIIASIWNHSVKMQEAARQKGISWPQFSKGDMADLLEFIRTPVKK